MTRPIISLLLCFTATLLCAQSSDIFLNCGSPVLSRPQQILQDRFDSLCALQTSAKTAFKQNNYTIPVVVHIIHQNGAENISDDRVHTAIEHLNQAFAHTGYYAAQVAGAMVPIQFCLATREPNGLPTTGIYRVESPLTEMVMEQQDFDLKSLSRRLPQQYVNIYVVASINSISAGNGVAGFSNYAILHGTPMDGIVCEAFYFGDSPEKDVVLIHEMGHYLNLYHTFEGGCKNDDCLMDGDHVCDTPPDQVQHSACDFNSCQTDTDDTSSNNPFSTDKPDATDNFMDYSPFHCYYAFTEGQSDRMLKALLGPRISLLSSEGCNLPCDIVVQADFSIPGQSFQVGDTLHFSDLSTGAQYWQWSVNGTVFSSQSEPYFVFDSVGIYDFSLTVSRDNAGCYSIENQKIDVSCPVNPDFEISSGLLDISDTLYTTNLTTNADSVLWLVNGVAVGTMPDLTYVFPGEGLYTITLKAYKGNCSVEKARIVRVMNLSCPTMVGARKFSVGIPSYSDPNSLFLQNILPNGDMFFFHGVNVNDAVIRTDSFGSVIWSWNIFLNPNGGLSYPVTLDNEEIAFCFYAPGSNPESAFAKLNADGTFAWAKNVIFPSWPIITELELQCLNDAILAHSYSSVTSSGNYFNRGHILKVGNDGTVLINKVIDFDEIAELRGGVLPAQNGGFWMAGTNSTFSNKNGLILLRFDAQGNIVFNRVFRLGDGSSMQIKSIKLLEDNGFVVAGSVYDQVNHDAFIWRFDSTGTSVWARRYLAASNPSIEIAHNICITPSGDIQVSYFSQASTQGSNGRLTVASDGTVKALEKITLPGNNPIYPYRYFRFGNQMKLQASQYWNTHYLFDVDGNGNLKGCANVEQIPFNSALLPFYLDTLVYVVIPDTNIIVSITPNEVPYTGHLVPEEICVTHPQCPEICFNNLDDDGDGLTDCADPDCICRPDAVATVNNITCGPDSLYFALEICNKNLFALPPGIPIAVYAGDPRSTAATALAPPVYTALPIGPDTCTVLNIRIPQVQNQPVFVVLNDDFSHPTPYDVAIQFPLTSAPETDYSNNFSSFVWSFPVPALELGPDLFACSNSVRTLHAGTGFSAYRWQDNFTDSTYTAFQPGVYWVDAQDACGAWQSDTVRIWLQPGGTLELGPDRVICPNDTVQLILSTGPGYSWEPSAGLDCADCPSVIAQPGVSTTYYVTASQGECFATDSIRILVSGHIPSADFSTDVQAGGMVHFTDASLFAQEILWDFGDGAVSQETDPTHIFSQEGPYNVTQTVWNECDTVQTSQSVFIAFPPIAGFSILDTIEGCAQATTIFDNQSSLNAQTFLWSFPGGSPAQSSDASPSVVYNISGTYTVILIVGNTIGMDTIIKTFYVKITDFPLAGFVFTVEGGGSVQFSDQSQHAAHVRWDFGDGSLSSEIDPTHIYLQEGQYTATQIVWNECDTVQTSQSVFIAFPPEAGFSVPDTIRGCVEATATFDNLSSLNAQTFLWNFPGGSPAQSNETSPSIVYNTSGTYTAILIVGNTTGTDTLLKPVYVEITALPLAGFSFAVQGGGSVQFFNQSQNGQQIQWNFGDGSVSSETDPSHVYSQEGQYAVTQTVWNTCDTVQNAQSVVIFFLPTAVFSVPDTVWACDDVTVSFDNQSVNGQSYQWSFPGGSPLQSNQEDPAVTYTASGIYSATLVVANNAGMDTLGSTFHVEILPVPIAGFSFDIQAGGTVQFMNTGQFAQQVLWEFGDGTSSTETHPVHTYSLPGVYLVTLTLSNICGAAVLQQMVEIIMIGVSQAGQGSGAEVFIYPNPTMGELVVDATRVSCPLLNIQVMDMQGRNLGDKLPAPANRLQFTLPEGASGFYLIRLQFDNGVYTGKVFRD